MLRETDAERSRSEMSRVMKEPSGGVGLSLSTVRPTLVDWDPPAGHIEKAERVVGTRHIAAILVKFGIWKYRPVLWVILLRFFTVTLRDTDPERSGSRMSKVMIVPSGGT
jgi:hypothetical protein